MSRRVGLGTVALAALMLVGGGVVSAGCSGDDAVDVPPSDDTGLVDETAETSLPGETSPGDDTGLPEDTAAPPEDTGAPPEDTGAPTDSGAEDTSSADSTATDSEPLDMGVDSAIVVDSAVADATDAAAPTLSISDVTLTEGNVGTKSATFNVTLSSASTGPVTVSFATADGTARATAGDYVGSSGVLTFPAGTTTQAITVLIDGDTIYEADETFTVTLSSPTGATLSKATGTGTITNDDAPPTLSIADVTATEGNTGTKNFTFTVSLTGATELPVTVNYATADGTATAGSDYTAATGTLTFAPGDLAKAITVLVNGDTTTEASETFTVGLSGVVNATLARATATGTITNDDIGGGFSTITIADASTTEGNTGTKTLNFVVTLSAAPAAGQSVTVNYATANGTAVTAGATVTGGADYVATSGTLTFAAGETTKNVSVTINGDTVSEADETFSVNLSGATATSGTVIITDNSAQGTITNDDTVPSISINDVSMAEGNAGVTTFTFTVTLSAASSQNVTVNFATAAGTATAGTDYINATGLLFFAPGETSKTINVTVRGDVLVEPNETFFVNLTTATNATIADAQGVGTIQNDD